MIRTMALLGACGILCDRPVASHLQWSLHCCGRRCHQKCCSTVFLLCACVHILTSEHASNQDFRDELVRLALRRERCASVTSQDLCKGSCWWDAAAMRCNLLAVEALLAVVDEDCPLRQGLASEVGSAVGSKVLFQDRAEHTSCLHRPRCHWDLWYM